MEREKKTAGWTELRCYVGQKKRVFLKTKQKTKTKKAARAWGGQRKLNQ
jgi:hypothetical protein